MRTMMHGQLVYPRQKVVNVVALMLRLFGDHGS